MSRLAFFTLLLLVLAPLFEALPHRHGWHETVSNAPSPSPEPEVASTSSSSCYLCGTQEGDGTFYYPGLGACGWSNGDNDFIVALAIDAFEGYPGAGADPNANPVCGKQIIASYQSKSVTVTVADSCPGCQGSSLDFSPSAFSQLADESLGRIAISWVWA